MFTIVYRSVRETDFSILEIVQMLHRAKEKNRTLAITGCLLYHQERFVQLLEGEERAVKSLYSKIRRDDRHHNVELLSTDENHVRLFDRWHMIFDDLEAPSPQVGRKRELFESLFQKPDIVMNPNTSKLALWHHVHQILAEEGTRLTGT